MRKWRFKCCLSKKRFLQILHSNGLSTSIFPGTFGRASRFSLAGAGISIAGAGISIAGAGISISGSIAGAGISMSGAGISISGSGISMSGSISGSGISISGSMSGAGISISGSGVSAILGAVFTFTGTNVCIYFIKLSLFFDISIVRCTLSSFKFLTAILELAALFSCFSTIKQ